MVLWAFNFIVVKSALAVLPPVGFTFLRFAIASTTLLILLRWREGSIGLPRRDLLAICGLGALGFGVYQILWTTGLAMMPAGDSALIIASTPVLVAILAVIAGSDVLTPAKLAGGVISFVGVAIVIASGAGLSLG
jgi:drug/metabolite transporter (DMT)-like permease